jgi:hypothetical protein
MRPLLSVRRPRRAAPGGADEPQVTSIAAPASSAGPWSAAAQPFLAHNRRCRVGYRNGHRMARVKKGEGPGVRRAAIMDRAEPFARSPMESTRPSPGGIWPGVRCCTCSWTHKMGNLQSKVRNRWAKFKASRPDRRTHGRELASSVFCFEGCFEACIAQLKFPLAYRRAIRTTNLPERHSGGGAPACLRRARCIQAFKLTYAAPIGAAERWRGVRMTEFKRRQLQAIRGKLDRAHAEHTGTRHERNRHRIPNSLYPARTRLDRTRFGRNSQDYLLTLQLLLRRYRRTSQ